MFKCNLNRVVNDENLSEIEGLYRFFLLNVFLYRNNYLRIADAQKRRRFDLDDFRCEVLGFDDWTEVFPEEDRYKDDDNNVDRIQQLKEALMEKYEEIVKEGIEVSETVKNNLNLMGEFLGLTEAEKFVLLFALVVRSMSSEFFNVFAIFPKKGNYSFWQSEIARFFSTMSDIDATDFEKALSPKGVLTRAEILKLDPDNWEQCPSLDIEMRNLKTDFFVDTDAFTLKLNEMCRLVEDSDLQWEDFVHLQPMLDRVKSYLQKVYAEGQRGVNILLYGEPGTGKTQLSRLIGQSLGCEVYEVPTSDDDGDPIHDRRGILVRNQLWLSKNPRAMLVFDEAQDVFKGENQQFSFLNLFGKSRIVGSGKGWMNKMLEENITPTFWLTNSVEQMDPAFIRRFDFAIEVPIPPRAQRTKIIAKATGGLVNGTFCHSLAQFDHIAPAVITRAATVTREIIDQNGETNVEGILLDQINSTLKAQGERPIKISALNHADQLYDPTLSTADVDLMELLQGVSQAQSARICLYGVPGTGKTAWARHLAERLNKPLLIKKCSDLLDCYVGGSEKNIAQAFEEATNEGAILLIDEVDSFLQKRSSAQRSWEVTQVNEMLTQMERFNGVFIATTNLLEGMDEACLRRFDLKVKFNYLDADKAVRLFKHYCRNLFGDVSIFDELLTAVKGLKNLAPGDFATVLRQSRFTPVKTPQALYEALVAECRVKGNKETRRIGF